MDINIVKCERKHIDDCKVALKNSELGRAYFSDDNKIENAINEGISKEQIYVAINNESICVGFLWYILNGAFHSFPYLHIIAIKDEFRNIGIGKKLMDFFEQDISKGCSKVFLVVADFNPMAKHFYEKIGYKEVGVIPGLYKKGISEHLMMKELY